MFAKRIVIVPPVVPVFKKYESCISVLLTLIFNRRLAYTSGNSTGNTNIAVGFAVYNNIFDHVSGATFGVAGSDGHCFLLLITGPGIVVDHNTCVNSHEGINFLARGTGVSDRQALVITNNIWHVEENPLTGAEVAAVSSAASYTNNLIVGGRCSGYPPGNRCPANWRAVGFVNYNNGNGGDYTLAAHSPYKGSGSDPHGLGTTDPGANVSAVNPAIACAVTGQCATTRQ